MDEFIGSLEELKEIGESERAEYTKLTMGDQELDSLTEVMKLTEGCNFTELDFGINIFSGLYLYTYYTYLLYMYIFYARE